MHSRARVAISRSSELWFPLCFSVILSTLLHRPGCLLELQSALPQFRQQRGGRAEEGLVPSSSETFRKFLLMLNWPEFSPVDIRQLLRSPGINSFILAGCMDTLSEAGVLLMVRMGEWILGQATRKQMDFSCYGLGHKLTKSEKMGRKLEGHFEYDFNLNIFFLLNLCCSANENN